MLSMWLVLAFALGSQRLGMPWEVWSESTVAGIIILPRYVNQCVAAMLRDRKRCTIDLSTCCD